MNSKIKRTGFIFFGALLPFLGLLGACQTMSAVASAGAQIAGGLGVIDQETADAISKSSDAIGKAAEDITPEQEYYIGRAVGANILASYKIYTAAPGLTTYLNRICNSIVINSPRPEIYNGYHVMILDSTEINAFATSGGHIFITRGLIDCTDSEDALAAVIAHEISHIQLQHSIKAIRTSRITQALLVTGGSAADVLTSGTSLGELTDIFDESVGEIVTTMVNNGYSQSQEFDADNRAMSLLASAGYDPSSLITMLRALEKNQPGHPGGFNKTHPAPARRISNAGLSVNNYPVEDTRPYRQTRYNTVIKDR
ncbi:MAG: M48 family metalloprotease [Treponema sp.]|jgi:predicted Zn-dependent protease|nr:M48 family metalloprotease [Treponema sp.]